MTTQTVNVFEKYGGIIGVRYLAESIFEDIEEDTDEIIVDFDNVEFFGRAVTQEYIRQKKKQNAKILEVNMCDNVKKMIEWVVDTWR